MSSLCPRPASGFVAAAGASGGSFSGQMKMGGVRLPARRSAGGVGRLTLFLKTEDGEPRMTGRNAC